MQQAGQSGTLTLLCGVKAYGIPLSNIAQATIEEFKSREARDAALLGEVRV
jgi:aspartate/glutamate racemase